MRQVPHVGLLADSLLLLLLLPLLLLLSLLLLLLLLLFPLLLLLSLLLLLLLPPLSPLLGASPPSPFVAPSEGFVPLDPSGLTPSSGLTAKF